MGGTFSVRLQGILINSLHNETFGSSINRTIAQTGQGVHSQVQVIGIGAEPIGSGDMNPVGYIYMKNLSTSGYVYFGPRNGSDIEPMALLEPSGEAWFKLSPSGSLLAKADYTGTLLQVKVFEA